MKILYLHQYFKTPEQAGSHRSWYIAKALAEAGFQVEIITSTAEKISFSQEIEQIKVHYLPVTYEQSMSFWRRIWAFFLFFIKAYKKASQIQNVDLIYATSTPLSIGLLAFLLKKFKHTRYIFEVRDLWPLVPIEMGFIKNQLIIKILYTLEKTIYQNAQKIVALSPSMQEYIRAIVPKKDVICVPNMADNAFFSEETTQPNKSKPFTITYFGSIGKANALERLIDIAKNSPFLQFWIIGKGSELDFIQKTSKGLPNIFFFEEQTKEQLRQTLQQTDAFFISFADFKCLETCSPNKFFDGLATGKLCITNTKGWIKDLIEQEQCGFYTANAQEFSPIIQNFLNNPSLLKLYQENAKKVAKKHFDRNILCSKIVSLIKHLA
ncbi:MAG: glycosyltransferase family 4 protein [Raineya sp.]|jgi:glycosyltransferase involved in cell wall biosynthesis|nr:glycosyltransferase family 4 protein [Raineya sp.]